MHFSSNTLDYMFDIWQALPITLLLVLCPHNLAYLLHQQKLFYLLIGKNNVFFFLSGPFLHRTRFMRVIEVGFTSKCSNAILLGHSGSHAILKVFLACHTVLHPTRQGYNLPVPYSVAPYQHHHTVLYPTRTIQCTLPDRVTLFQYRTVMHYNRQGYTISVP